MPLLDRRCTKCNQPLALADRVCASCGAPVPQSQRLGVMLTRVEELAESGHYVEAARSVESVLAEFSEAKVDKLLWRKRGGWLLRSGRADLMDGAESALAESLRLDDNDDLSHQLWIDVVNRRGQIEKARAWYRERLALNPEDGMAKRQMAILRLTSDFKNAPAPKLNLPPVREGLLYRMIKPTMGKAITMGFSTLGSAAQFFWAMSSKGSQLADQPELAGVGQFLNDPWMPGIMTVLGIAYMFWAWKELRG